MGGRRPRRLAAELTRRGIDTRIIAELGANSSEPARVQVVSVDR